MSKRAKSVQLEREPRLLQATRALAKATRAAAQFENAGKECPLLIRIQIEHAKRDHARELLMDQYGHKRGTPETYAKIDAIPANRRQSPIDRMYESGQITIEQQAAATEIAVVAEAIERMAGVRGASLEARVDNEGASRDVLLETLSRIRLEATYTAWRNQLPMPRRMYLDMILTNRSLVATARVYGAPWRPTRARLLRALDRWHDLKEITWRTVDEGDVQRIYAKLGEGILLPPRPKIDAREDAA